MTESIQNMNTRYNELDSAEYSLQSVRKRRTGILTGVWHVIRKFITISVTPLMPVNTVRVWLYRRMGFRIGKRVIICMKCYLDDIWPERLVIEDGAIVSYNVTFVAHGPGRGGA